MDEIKKLIEHVKRLFQDHAHTGTDSQKVLMENLGNVGGLHFVGFTTSATIPSTSNFGRDRDVGVHRDTTANKVYLAYNDLGTIKKVELT